MSYSRHTCLEFPSRNPASPPSEINDPSSSRTTAHLSAFQEKTREFVSNKGAYLYSRYPPTPPPLPKMGLFFLQVGPHGYSMTQNSDDKRQKVSKRHQIPSAPLSQFTDAFFAIKNFARSQKYQTQSSKYADQTKKKGHVELNAKNLQQKLRTQ